MSVHYIRTPLTSLNSSHSAASGIKWTGIGRSLAQLVTWAMTLVVIRILSPDDYGLVAVCAVVVGVIASIAELGLGASIVQAKDPTPSDVSAIFGLVIAVNGLCLLAVALGSGLIAMTFGDPRLEALVSVAALQFLAGAFSSIPEALAYRQLQFKRVAMIDFVSAVSTSVVTLGMALAGAGVWSLVLGTLLGAAIRAAGLVGTSPWIAPSFHFRAVSSHVRFGGALTGSRLAWSLAQQCDVLIGGRFLSEQQVGVYAVAANLAKMPMNKLMAVINQVAFPVVSRMQSDEKQLRWRILNGVRLLGFLVIPILWGIAATAPDLVTLLLGPRWGEAVLPLQLVSIVVPVQMLSNVFSTAVTGFGRVDVELKNMLIAGLVIPATLFVGVRAGASGLAAGWAVGTILALLLNLPRALRVLGVDAVDVWRSVRAPLVGGAAMLLALLWLRSVLSEWSELARLVAMTATGAGVYVSLVVAVDRMMFVDMWRFLKVIRRA